MKATKSIKERLFVMHLKRELDYQQLRGETPKMKHAVHVAKNNTILTLDYIEAELKSAAGGE